MNERIKRSMLLKENHGGMHSGFGEDGQMPYMHLITVCEDFSKEKSSCRGSVLAMVSYYRQVPASM